jgi:FtsP/CotA-like multicopper oxidase with cupredoxin domain
VALPRRGRPADHRQDTEIDYQERSMSNHAPIAFFSVVALSTSIVAIGLASDAKSTANGTSRPAAVAKSDAGRTPTLVASLGEMFVKGAFTAAAGDVDITVTNSGAAPHALALENGPKTAELASGAVGTLHLADLKPGQYVLYCPIAGHREAGMNAELTVTEAGTDPTAADHAAVGHSKTQMTRADVDKHDAAMAVRTKAFPAKTVGVGGQLLKPKVLRDGTKVFALTTALTKWEVEAGKFVEAMTYNGTVPGPTIKVDVGDNVRVELTNKMPTSTAIHFHGVRVPNTQDGVPDITQPPVKPGEKYAYEFVVTEPAVGMYHSHHDAQIQVPGGLAGAFLVGEMRLPKGVKATQEHTIMLNDSGAIGYSLNGKSFPATAPYAAKKGEWLLFHYLNEGTQIHPMHLHGFAQLVVAKDGYPLPMPYNADTINVAPGERYSVLVRADLAGVWAWHCHVLPHAEREDGMFGMVTALVVK